MTVSLPLQALSRRLPKTAAAFATLLGLIGPRLHAQPVLLPAPSPGLIETGAPSFLVSDPQSLGLSAAPVDLKQMPDGRMLAFGQGEFALGDGVRWEVFKQAPKDLHVETRSVEVDAKGRIYAGVPDGFARIEMEPGGAWVFKIVAPYPAGLRKVTSSLTSTQAAGGRWFWSHGSGPIVEWNPGEPARIVGRINAVERFLAIDGNIVLSDGSTGDLYRLQAGEFTRENATPKNFVYDTFTCAVALDAHRTLIGTIARGLLVSDGDHFRPLQAQGLLGPDYRINDLIATEGGLFAAAINNVGIVFFDRSGRTVQVLDRTLDQRLSRVKRLLRTPGGTIWALLNEGIARVAFPSRISYMEPFVPTALAYAQPYRYQGHLWLMSDGRAEQGQYDADGRLTAFAVDSPPGYLSSLATIGGDLLACSTNGIFLHEKDGSWMSVSNDVKSAYIFESPDTPGRWLYAAENETGWIVKSRGDYSLQRFPDTRLGHVYGGAPDEHGAVWIELGTGKVGRILPTSPRPKVSVFGSAQGVPNGWAQLFFPDGAPRINTDGGILRFDTAKGQFTPDPDLLRHFPQLQGALGRPARDAFGRLWITHKDHVLVVDPSKPAPNQSVESLPQGLVPIFFTAQADGVVWLHQRMRLARFDPLMPAPAPAPLHALITSVVLPSGTRLISSGENLGNLPSSDNSLTVYFDAPDTPLDQPVSFDVKLSGARSAWISTGSTGSAVFDHVDHGSYVLLVRPHIGSQVGTEARLRFSVRAPWFETPLAYAGYILASLSLVALLVGTASYLERRGKSHLERIVNLRTNELHEMNRELGRQMKESNDRAAALKVSEDRYRRLSDNAPDIIFRLRTGPDTGFDYISPAVAAITGYTPDEFYATPQLIGRIASPAGPDNLLDLARNFSVPTGAREATWIARDGRRLAIEMHLVPVHSGAGNLVAIEGIARDVTDRKRAIEQIRTLSEAIEQSPVSVFITDPAGSIVFANPSLQRLIGYSNSELTGRSLGRLRADFVRPDQLEEIWTALTRGERWNGQVALRRKDGRILHLRSTFAPLRNPDGTLRNHLALLEDISEALEEHDRRHRLEAQLAQVQKLESLGTLAGGIAHDFNNILTGILGYCELADFALQEGRSNADELREIRAGGLRAKELVSQILTFSRRGESRLAPVELSTVVVEALKLVRASTPASIAIEAEFDPGIVKADASQIHQIVVNLCTNAVHAMRGAADGRLSVAVRSVLVDSDLAGEIQDLSPGSHLCLSVGDTGCGMDDATLARIFDPFFTTKRTGEGTGLGLSIVRGIVANHGAALRVRSSPGRGTTFDIYFPVSTEALQTPDSARPPPPGGQREILVVDDEPTVAGFVAASLRHYAYRTTVHQDPLRALDELKAAPGRFHALVTDLTMPHLTGLDLIRQARAVHPDIPAIVITGFKKELARDGHAMPAQTQVLIKPFASVDLARILGQLLGPPAT